MAFFNSLLVFLSVGLHVLQLPFGALGQDAPLWVQGTFEDATLVGDAYNSGGVIVVEGYTMKVPENLLVQFPAAWVPWKDFVASKTDFLGFETLVSSSSGRISSEDDKTNIAPANRLSGTASTETPRLHKYKSTNSSRVCQAVLLSLSTKPTEA